MVYFPDCSWFIHFLQSSSHFFLFRFLNCLFAYIQKLVNFLIVLNLINFSCSISYFQFFMQLLPVKYTYTLLNFLFNYIQNLINFLILVNLI